MRGKQPYNKTLCWDCQKAINGCSWAKHFVPVEGWTAIQTLLQGNISSYHVIDCPEFEKDKPYKKPMKRQGARL